MLWLIALYLVMVFLVPLALSALVRFRALSVGRACPCCAAETLQLEVPYLTGLRRLLGWEPFHQRWCLECGWLGFARPRRAERAETLDVRTISIDGRTWTVVLHCWSQTREYYGRLVFVEPTGRLWTDGAEAFRGASRFDVIGQALAMPDRMLTSRLRRILSES